MKECTFCKIVNGELPSEIVYETKDIISFLDINPINQGHTLIVPKQHIEDFHNLPADLLNELIQATSIVTKAILKSFNPDGYNIFCNNGHYAGQSVFHFHFHVTPRFRFDGIKFKPNVKHYKKDEMKLIAEKIREKIKN